MALTGSVCVCVCFNATLRVSAGPHYVNGVFSGQVNAGLRLRIWLAM